MSPLTPRIIAALVGIALVVLLLIFGPQACNSYFAARQEARNAKGQAEASVNSGAEAMNTVSNVSAGDDRIDAEVKGATDEIRAQPAGNSNNAALRASCRLRSFRDDERCAALRRADTGNASAGGAQR